MKRFIYFFQVRTSFSSAYHVQFRHCPNLPRPCVDQLVTSVAGKTHVNTFYCNFYCFLGFTPSQAARFSTPVQSDPGAHPTFYTMGTGSFFGGKAVGTWRWPPLCSAEVKESVELCLYTLAGPSWSILWCTLPFLSWLCMWKWELQWVYCASHGPIVAVHFRKAYGEVEV
jgi:hypothetical protein